MLTMMVMMYSWVWENEYASEKWVKGVLEILFKKRDKADQGNYLEMTLLRTVCQKICNILDDTISTMLKKDKTMSKGQAGSRLNRSCVDHVYTLGKLIDSRKNARLWKNMDEWVVEKCVGRWDRRKGVGVD